MMTRDGDQEILSARGLHVEFPGGRGPVKAVNNVTFSVSRGETLGIVGESGCGKSMTMRALLGLVPAPGRMTEGSVTVEGRHCESVEDLERLRGEEIAMIFQDPSTSLNPVHTVGSQVAEVLRVKGRRSRRAARAEATELLGHVGIPEPGRRFGSYPHELSGGMRQRVMIACAIACRPKVLLADEPTTALDVTTQEQILRLLLRLQDESGMAIVIVTHDLGVIEEVCDEVLVMYAGYVVERGETDVIAHDARHPYTKGLVAAMPKLDGSLDATRIEGQPPGLGDLPAGCPFAARCPIFRPACTLIDMEALSVEDCACPFVAGDLLRADPDGGRRSG